MKNSVITQGKPLDLSALADQELAKALQDHHTDGQTKCIDHVMYRYANGQWISTGESC